jgi:ABC-type amino acid transport substrate-binding protein
VILVRADEADIVDEASLVASDAPVGTQIGTTNEAVAIDLVGEDRVQSFDTFDLPVQALIAGDVDAVIIDEEAANGFAERNPGKIKITGDPLTGEEQLGFVFPPGSDWSNRSTTPSACSRPTARWMNCTRYGGARRKR